MEQKYNFTELERLLDKKFPYASDWVEVLERIESALTNLEQVVRLQPEIVNAIDFFEEMKMAIDSAIPNDKRRF